mmetsp:Transcript_28907/g.33065  ORF Transcript_28907/g.33065 Transcript_28907/m.33065 type:complete len:95 (-) Transcript_28907:42-326(-)
MMQQQLYKNIIVLFIPLLLAVGVEARKRSSNTKYDDYESEYESVLDYVQAFLKVTLACSPILIIGGILFFAREDGETEKAKCDARANSKGCGKS